MSRIARARFSPAQSPAGRLPRRSGRAVRRPADAREGRRSARRQRSSPPARATRGCTCCWPAAGPRRARCALASAAPPRSSAGCRGDELAAAYASADLFLFCSQTDTFGQVILEAQASGLPVVAVAAGGPAELVADGRSGVLCPPRVDDLADAVVSLAGSRAAPRAARARRARRRGEPLVGGEPRPAGRRLAARAGGQHRARARGRRTLSVIEAGLAPACPRRRRRGRHGGAVRARHADRRRHRLRPRLRARAAARRVRRRRAPDRGGGRRGDGARPWPACSRTATSRRRTSIRLATVAAGSALAVAIAGLRTRLQRANVELGEALGLLDVVFAHAPVGIALLDRDLRFLRVNDRLAEISGVPADDHRGHTIGEILPRLPAQVRAGRGAGRAHRDAAERGRGERPRAPLDDLVLARPPRRGADRRRHGGDRGHRAARGRAGAARADRPLRDAPVRALRRRRGPGAARARRPLRLRELGVRAAQRLHVPGARRDGLGARPRGRVRGRRAPRCDEARRAGSVRCAVATAHGSTSRSAPRRSTSRAVASSSWWCAT